VNRMLKSDHPYHRVGRGTYPVFDSQGMADIVSRVEKIDARTVRFHLSKPFAPFLANIAMDFMSIQSAEYAAQLVLNGANEQIDLAPVGTGPYILEDYRQDSTIRYRANPSYWNGAPRAERLVFDITPDATVRFEKLKAGDCQVMAYPNPADLVAMRRDAKIRLLEAPGHNIGYLAFNTRKPPLDDERIRRALALAVDRDSIVRSVFLGEAIIADNPIPPTMDAWNPDTSRLARDVEKASSLLREAGYPAGFDIDLWAMPVQRAYNPNARRMAELIQEDWASIGVTTNIVSYEWGEYISRSRAGEHEAILLGWTGQNADPDNFLYTLLSCASVNDANRARWCNPNFDRLIRRARVSGNRRERIALYREAQTLFNREIPWLPIAHAKVFVPIRKEVKHYKIDPMGGQRFENVEFE
jgi:dipeptide transport system substrate-binding protein